MAYFGYKKVFRYYDSERRERRGYYEGKPDASTARGYDFTNSYMPQFNIDISDLPKTVQLLELSNGITFNIELRAITQSTSTQKRLTYRLFYNDINGNIIPSISMGAGYEVTVLIHNNGIIDNKIQVYPALVSPNYAYSTVQGSAPASIYTGTVFFRNYSETSLYPQLNQFYTRDFLIGGTNPYYVVYDSGVFYNENDWVNQWLNVIKNGGDDTPITPILPSEDTSGVGGGDSADPDYNPFSDPINFPDLPTGGSALASGFIKLYHPSSGELNQLAAKLWSDNFFEEIKKIQNDPLEAIVSLHSVPFGIVGASRQSCRIGNYDSEITMDTIGAQFYTVDCGNIAIPEHWASALDYAPYTDIEIYLPFCGVKPLQIDDVMNRVLNVKYNIDILTGAAICMVKCGDSVLYTYNTEIAQNIPISASNHAQLYQSIISAASAVVGVASGGAGAVVGAVQSAATVAASKHSQVSRGGSLGGSVGVLGDFVPYLIIHRPIQSLAADFAHKKGYPSNITATLSSVSGYTEVDSIHLENIPCTDMEREELYRIMQEGVIL